MVSIEYANAYTEVIEILKYIPIDDYKKIPKRKIELFEANANREYKFSYNPELTLDEQKTSKIAKTIIAILFRDYWATDRQREMIIAKEKYDIQKKYEEMYDKYSFDKLFYKPEKNEDIVQNQTAKSMVMVEYKEEKILKKIINKIKKILKINF